MKNSKLAKILLIAAILCVCAAGVVCVVLIKKALEAKKLAAEETTEELPEAEGAEPADPVE